MIKQFLIGFASVLFFSLFSVAALAGVTFRLPDFTVRPGDSGTFDALVEFSGTQPAPPPPPYYSPGGFRVTGYSANVSVSPGSSGFRMPSVADGIFGPGFVTAGENSIGSSNGIACITIFPPSDGCPPAFPAGSHLLVRADYHVNPHVTPGTEFNLEFASAHISDFYRNAYPVDAIVGGNVSVVASDVPVLGGPIGPGDFPAGIMVEEFDLGLTSPVPVPLVVSNAVITTRSGSDLNFPTNSNYAFGPAIAQRYGNDSIIANFTVDTLQAGAWVGGPSNRGVLAEFYSGDTLLGDAVVHSLYNAPVFVGFESLNGFITRAVFSLYGGGGTAFTLDRLTTTAQPGDFNGDGNVDAADYTAWRNLAGQTGANLAADGTGPDGTPDGIVDGLDFELWKANYGASASANAAALITAHNALAGEDVPEPGSLAIAALGLILLSICRLIRRPALASAK